MVKKVNKTLKLLINLLYETLSDVDCYTDECPFQKVCENYCNQYNLTLCELLWGLNQGGKK